MCCARRPHKCRHGSRAQCPKIVVGHSIYLVFLSAPSRVDALFTCSPAHLAMPLAVQGSHLTSFDELPTGHRRQLYRRSSCPSIPRSVSACSSLYAIDFNGEFSNPSVPTDWGDVEIYMSPLFRGLGGIGEESGEAAELMSDTPTGGSRAETIDCDDSISDSLSNYQFDIIGHDHIPEPTKVPQAKLSAEQSSTPTHARSLMAPDKPLKPSQPFPPPRVPSPSPEPSSPSVPPKPTRPSIPMNTDSTRPLKIDRSRKRTGPSVTSQRAPRAEAKNVAPTSKPVSRATTHVNLREAYRRDRLHAEQKVPTRGVTPAMPSYPYPRVETRLPAPDKRVTQTQVDTKSSPDTFASYQFISFRRKSLSPHCFQLVLFLLIVRKINSNMHTVWTDFLLNLILLTLQRQCCRRGTPISAHAGLSVVHLKGRRPEIT